VLKAMANLRTIRILLIFVMLFLLPCLCICSPAQVIPFAPGFPTDVKQCQSFGVEVDAYTAEYSQQHEKCLADHKADHTTETDPLTCTRSECQYLHDMLHGNSVLSAKSLSAEVSSCYAKVREYQAQEAQKAKEEEERRARDKREEAEGQARDKKDEAERAASRQRDKDEREARDAKRAADKSERDQVEEQREAADRRSLIGIS
jgi:hypothetical protein